MAGLVPAIHVFRSALVMDYRPQANRQPSDRQPDRARRGFALPARPGRVRRRRRRGVALHAAILRSSVAHGRIRSIDTSAALKQPGVHAVITAAEIGTIPIITMRQELLPEYAHFQQPVIANEKVRYVGEPIAVVVADSAALAEDALDAIVLDIEALPAVASRAASRADASLLYEARGSNLVGTLTALRGDADAAFKDAAYVRRERFEVQRFTAVPMEPRGLLAEWDAAKHLTVFGAAKVAFHNRAILAKHAGARRRRHHHGRVRRRRRLRRARRVLSRGFPDPVRGAPARPRR